ncbi:glycosyltransferase family 8 protein, partial [Saccharata proteae CBS 121410]
DDSDPYYLSTRLLAYQLLHSPVRSNLSIDFVVFITDDVSDPKRTRLMRDGASVVLAGKVHSDWLAPDDAPRNQNSLAKLRLWQMGQYERVCFLDPDHLVLGSLDGVFEDPAASMHKTRGDKFGVHSDEATLPASYSFAAQGDDKADSFSAGFFVTKPSLEMLSYYSSLLAAHIRGRFDNTQASPEQGLLNYAHRAKGNMPWQKLRGQWSVSGGGKRDWERGAVAFHERFW